MVFTRKKGTEIRKAWETNEAGEKEKVLFIIGRVDELLRMSVIFDDNTSGNENKWLLISADGNSIEEFNSLEEAKKAATER